MSTTIQPIQSKPPVSQRKPPIVALLGPAFIAAIAYVDPGNVAANITAGARYGYLLLWVLVCANLMAMLIQYMSAKLGIVTGKSLPEILGDRLPRSGRILFWIQAELIAGATDLAEVIGGAIALNLLFGIPLLWSGVIIGAVSLFLLGVQNRRGQRTFEFVIIGLLMTITLGFLLGLFVSPPDVPQMTAGLLPRFAGSDSVLVAASMLGATVMPHAVYLHSSLVIDRHGADSRAGKLSIPHLLRATRFDIVWALSLAGIVNIGLLLLAASALSGVEGTDTIEGAHAAITSALGGGIGKVFAIGLLASGLASTSVGAYAGSEIMKGLLHIRVPLLARRAVTLVPALLIIAWGVEPTWALVLSQMALSFGIPLAIIPLMLLTRSRKVMGEYADSRVVWITGILVASLIIALNILLIFLSI
ncbi:MAG: divalent metal cation transporter [Actinobacteria bacterium]|nr:MAG: divalent metal cation transporter [Actinomycetota bacterium]